MASNQELPTTSSTTTPDGSVVYPLPTPAVAVAATTTATNEVASSPATITTDWGHVCHQRLMDSSTSLESLLVILQDLKKALDNTNVNSTNSKATATTTTTTKEERNNGIPIPFMLTTLLPAVLTAFQTRTKPTPQSQSMDYPLRMACLEWVTQLVSISAAAAVPSSSSSSSSSSNTRNNTNAADHENPSNNNHYHALLRPGAPQVIAVALTVLIHDCEDPAVLASRLIFDLFKTYQTSITTGTTTTAAAAAVTPTTSTTTHIGGTGTNTPTTTAVVVQTYLDFVASLYRNLPTALSRNFRPSTLVPPPVSSSSSSSTIAAAAVVPVEQHQPAIVSGESPMDVDDGATENPNSGEETAAAADPMDVDDTPLKGQLEIAKTAAAIAHDNTPKESRTASIMKRGSSSLEAMSVASTASLGGLSVVAPVPPPPRILLASNASFKVLTECPLVVMLMFQLYPQFMKSNIPILIKVMMESLALRPPSLQSVSTLGAAPSSLPSFSMATPLATSGAADSSSGKSSSNKSRSGKGHKIDSSLSRAYFSRVRELVAAQAKTLSFLTYLLRTFSEQLKPYEDVLATNVVALMSTCPRESIGTRKELLVATRHLLNSDFRSGFYRHIDAMLDERLLMGTSSQHNNYSSASGLSGSSSHRQDPAMIRPLAYNALSDFVQHARTLFTMTQMSRVVCLFSRILHDTSRTLPLTSQYTAVRTLLSVIDLIFHNKDPDAQLGRDMLVRMLDTLVDKLQALTEYFPDLALMESKRDSMEQLRPYDLNGATVTSSWILLNHPHSSNVNNNNSRTLDSVRDIQSLIRAIIVGQKTIIYYISTYRSHRVELLAAKAASDTSALSGSSSRDLSTITPLPPPGSNEEVASAMLKITHTEIAIIDRYIIAALSAMKLLSDSSTKSDDDVAPQWHLAPQTPMSTSQSLGTTEKTLADQHRDALTYFAAAFTSLDGFNLRRSLGQRLDVLVDAIVADPMVMVVPRHLLGSNATTSFEFCSVLLDYLVERMDQLSGHRKSDFIFIDDQPSDKGDLNKRPCEREQLHAASQRPEENESKIKQRGATLLQLFERVLKSLSVHPDNETVVRRHLRRIVVVCLRSSMENTGCWPESYCMLVRYVFRSISAGKFEDSYRTLLPLISSVLNGLYRVVCSSENSVLRSTAIELCLTIPARLSSLLPHMNLLLRIIIPALDSNIGDLVNLGLRTLEFWVDNLNPLFLYPEMSKQTELFSALMQSLSLHLRPAPYPYGLLTLRLLGKLGGKNRQFLREPMPFIEVNGLSVTTRSYSTCSWSRVEEVGEMSDASITMTLPLPITECVEILRSIALQPSVNEKGRLENIYRRSDSFLWECKIEELDFVKSSHEIVTGVENDQAAASFTIVSAAMKKRFDRDTSSENDKNEVICSRDDNFLCLGLFYACMIDSTCEGAWALVKSTVMAIDCGIIADSLCQVLSQPSSRATSVGMAMLDFLLDGKLIKNLANRDSLCQALVCVLCDACCSSSWERQSGLQDALRSLTSTMGGEWSRKYEVRLINATLQPVKTVPRELTEASVCALRVFIMMCSTLYGERWTLLDGGTNIVRDILSSKKETDWSDDIDGGEKSELTGLQATNTIIFPCDAVFKITVYELTSPQQLSRFAARFLLTFFVVDPRAEGCNSGFISKQVDFIRRVLFSRSLRLLPLPHQLGVVEGLTAVVKLFPDLLPLTDPHLLACISDLLKMASVADGEMSDEKLTDVVVDKDGYVSSLDVDVDTTQYPTHASALLFRRTCVFDTGGVKIVVPGELPSGVQLRVSTIILLHTIVKTFTDPFFDAETTTAVGNIRPHVISLLFRSLVSIPLQAVNAAHDALSDVLTLSGSPKLEEVEESSTSQSRLPKELLQTCLRPVLLNLREYTKLSVPLLRGLSRLLSLLSTWFNKTLGEKLLDHLRKWTEPGRILSLNIWKEGEEPIVAAAIVSIFSSLPQAAMFVEPLVKTCIKLESTILSFKARFLSSPYRLPLARYLNKHAQYTVSFFFPRLKSPMYSELFQHIIQLEESLALREYLSNKQCSVMLLNVCFERPLSIIRSEKTASSGGFAKSSLMLHGIGQQPVDSYDGGRAVQRPMTIETLEVQHQGFRLVGTLLANNPDYFCNHNDIVRAFRWLWRSKGRCLRLQHEEIVAPRFHNESKMLAYFLMSYVKSFTSEDLDILFELFRVFLQPSTSDFAFVSRFLVKMVTSVLSLEQKRKVIQRFFASIAGDTNEEIKVLGIQFLVFPMMAEDCRRRSNSISSNPTPGCFSGQTSTNLSEFEADTDRKKSSLMDDGVIKKFANEVIFLEGSPVNYGDRLKVELLRLLYLFVEFNAPAISPFKNELVKYCWGLLKSEDMPCKCWAYVVVCRFIASFEIPEKIIRQVYASVLRFSQLENKELVRSALDLLVPALPTRLSHSDFSLFMENTCQLIADEGSSLQTLTHVGQIIIRYSSIFQSHCVRFVAPLISCIHRLGLSAPGTDENRCIAMSIVELLLQWHRTQDDMARLLDGRSETICNFLIQFKIITADGLSDQRHPTKVDTSATGLDARITESLEASLALWNPKISSAPIEKCIAKPIKGKGPLRACLEIISMAVEFKKFAFLSLNSSLVQRIIVLTVDHARDDMVMQGHLRLFVSNVKTMSSLTSHMLVALEKVVEESKSDKKTGSLERNSDRARGKERSSGNDDGSVVSVFTLFCLELIADLFRINSGTVNYVATTLLSVAKSLSKAHLAETATRQRQGSSVAARSSSTGIRHRTPTIGILEEAHLRGQSSVLKAMKSRSGKDEPSLSTQLRCIVVILSVFEDSDLVYTFTQDRKSLLEIIHGILESSDNVQLLMAAIRCVGKWMTSKQSCSPFTVKERNDLLIRISNFDLCNLPDDIISHPLADLVSAMVLRLRNSSSINDCDEFRRLAAACLLHTNSVVREEIQGIVFSQDFDEDSISAHTYYTRLLSSALGADYEALSARFWIVCIVDFLMRQLATDKSDGILDSLRVLAHGNISVCQKLSKLLFSFAWNAIQDNQLRVKLILLMESLLAKTYHAQLHQTGSTSTDTCSFNSVRMFLNIISCLNPIPLIDTHLLTYVAENYNCWYEVISLLEKQYLVMTPEASSHVAIAAMRHCYRHLGEDDIWRCLALESCVLPKTKVSISLDVYDLLEEAANEYAGLMSTDEAELDPTDFEMDLWEERWVMLQKELCQVQVVSEFARVSEVPSLQLECAWKAQDWSTVRSLCSSAALLSAIEKGDPMVKLSETLLAVADGKLSDVENLHAQTAQLCLYKWQLLPRLSSGSHSHASLLHIFHRLVEVRESGQIMVETSKHSNGRTLPDLKNLLSAWRYRLPNDWEKISIWDEVFAWRAHMFSAITSNFHWCEPDMLATQHDRPWTALRMAKSARKQGIRDVARLLLHKATEEQAMNVSDAYVKLREQILTYLNPESKLELTGGLSLIEATNLSFFDESQKSELFRLKALFLQSLQSRSKANQAFCHSVQICPTHARAWDSWGELCASLGTVTEKQREQSGAGGNGTEGSKDVAKKVRQYLAQAMGCYLEAIQIDGHEWARIRIPKCLWMLTKDGSTPGVLCQTLETRGAQLPAWVWLPWIPQLLTSLYRREGQAIKSILTRIVKIYPQAVYYPLRAFYLERRDVDRVKSSTTTSSPPSQGSVARAEELMSLLRRSHASLWSALESCLEELIVTFRPSYEEELLATLIVLLERAESQIGSIGKKDDEQAIVSSVWKTLGKIAVKFFRTTESSTTPNDARVEKTALFKNSYKTEFELDFLVSANEESSVTPPETSIHRSLDDVIAMLRRWKVRLEDHVLAYPESTSLIDASNSLAMFGVGDSPDLWPGSCDPSSSSSKTTERESMYDTDASTTQTSTSSSAAAARKAAKSATQSASEAAMREGIGGDYGGGSSWIEIPGQYIPNTSSFTDVRPSPELHAKLIKFESSVSILRRSDTLVRRIGMASSDGKTYHFLLQFAVPYLTRTDERNSQTHFVLDKVLRKSVRSSRALLAAQSHPVIPVAQRLRLVSEPVRRTSLDEIHRQVCLQKQMDHSKLSKHFNDEVKRILNEKSEIEELEESDRAQVEKSVRLEVFSNVCNSDEVDDMMLMDHLLSTLHGPERLYQFRRVFSQQWACNCLLQYVFSVLERTPSKVVFDFCSGRVLAPEFRIAYTNQGCFERQPTPFRLSPNLATLIGFPILNSRFVVSMATIAGAVKSCHQDLDPIFRLLMRDDLVAFYTKSVAKSDAKTFEMEKQLSGSVSRNVAALHSKFSECAPTGTPKIGNEKEIELLDQKVRDLVTAARNPENLCLMSGNYQGWL